MNEEIHSTGNNKRDHQNRSFFDWGSSSFVGSCLIVLGGYFIGREMGWLDYKFPFWAVFMILAGIWMVFSSRKRNR